MLIVDQGGLPSLKQVHVKWNRWMLLKENLFFKIKELSEYERQYNRNKITYLSGSVPKDPQTGTGNGPRPSGWGPL